MNWNPFKRIADLERKVSDMHYELLQLAASNSSRLRKLEHKMGRESVLADFENHTVQTLANLPTLPTELLTLEQTQALIDKRVRQNAAARKSYAKRKRLEAKAKAVQGERA
jgi:hypothetical protein